MAVLEGGDLIPMHTGMETQPVFVGESPPLQPKPREQTSEKLLSRKEMAREVERYAGEHFSELLPYYVGRQDVGFDASVVIDHLMVTDEDINRIRPDLHIGREAGRSVLRTSAGNEITHLGFDKEYRIEDMFAAAYIRDTTTPVGPPGKTRRWRYAPKNRVLQPNDFGIQRKENGKPVAGDASDIAQFASCIRYEFQRIGDNIHTVSDQFEDEAVGLASLAGRDLPSPDALHAIGMVRMREIAVNEKAKQFLLGAVNYNRAWQRMDQNLLSTADKHYKLLHDDPVADYFAFIEGGSDKLSTAFQEPTPEQVAEVGSINFVSTPLFAEPILTRGTPDAQSFVRRLKTHMLPFLARRCMSSSDARLNSILEPIVRSTRRPVDSAEALHSQIVGYTFLQHLGVAEKHTGTDLSKQANEAYELQKKELWTPVLNKELEDAGLPVIEGDTISAVLAGIDRLAEKYGRTKVQDIFTVAKQVRFQASRYKTTEPPILGNLEEDEPEWLEIPPPPEEFTG